MAKKCPLCKAENKPTAKFCSICGTSLPEEVQAWEEEQEYSLPVRVGIGFLQWFLESFPGLFSPGTLVMCILACAVGLTVTGLGAFLFTLGAVLSGMMTAALGVICYWSACTWLICGYVCLPSEGLADFRTGQWWAFALVGFGPFVAALAAIAMAQGPG